MVTQLLCYDYKISYADVQNADFQFAVRSTHWPSHQNHVTAHFTDRDTVDAMASAPPIVRLFLEEAGFGARIAQSAPCESEESENDTGMQRALIRQLSVTLENRAMKKALARASSDGAFNIHHLIAAVVAQNDRLPDAEDEDDESAQFVAEHKVIPRRPSELYRARSRRRARPV